MKNEQGGVVRKGETSVSEEITRRLLSCGVLKVHKHNNFRSREIGKVNFHASGREDMDVRMLSIRGEGRPFVLEVKDCDRMPGDDELRRMERVICGGAQADAKSEDYGDGGGGVGVKGLQLVEKEDFSSLQKATENKVNAHFSSILCPRFLMKL